MVRSIGLAGERPKTTMKIRLSKAITLGLSKCQSTIGKKRELPKTRSSLPKTRSLPLQRMRSDNSDKNRWIGGLKHCASKQPAWKKLQRENKSILTGCETTLPFSRNRPVLAVPLAGSETTLWTDTTKDWICKHKHGNYG